MKESTRKKIKIHMISRAISFGITALFFWGVRPDPIPGLMTTALTAIFMYEINYIMVLDIWIEAIEKRKPAKPQVKQAETWHYEAFDTRNMNYDMSHWADEEIGA